MTNMHRAARVRAYNQAIDLARQHGLIHQAAGGVVVLVHPDTQDEQGITERCLRMAGITETTEGEIEIEQAN